MTEIGELLNRSRLTCGLPPEFVEGMAALGKTETYRPSERLASIGEQNSDLFVIVEGRVNVVTHDDDKLSEAGPAGILGEVAFVDAGPRHANFVAVGRVEAVRFPAKELRAHLCGDKAAGFMVLANLSRLLAVRMRNAENRLDALMDLEVDDVWENVL